MEEGKGVREEGMEEGRKMLGGEGIGPAGVCGREGGGGMRMGSSV